MTEALERYVAPSNSLELASEAWPLAQKIARTEFVPGALRGKPEAVLACMLTGHEIGVGPMQSLSKIHVIDGKPGLAAELMRAIILRAGHTFDVEEISNTRVTVVGQRLGSSRETRITWTLDDAKTAGVGGKDVWRKYPRAMLLARATAELARAVFPDVLAGLSYTVEELVSGDVDDPMMVFLESDVEAGAEAVAKNLASPTAPVAKKAAAKKAATRKAAAPKATSPTPPPLPGEDDDDGITEAEIVHEGDDVSKTTEARPLSGPAAIAVAVKRFGIDDRAEKLAIVSEILDREIESTNDLDVPNVSYVLNVLNGNEDDVRPMIDEVVARVRSGSGNPGSSSTNAPPFPPPPPAAPAPPPPAEVPKPETWSEPEWRTFLAERSVKVTELLREAQRLAREDGDAGPGTLEDLVTNAGDGLKGLLVGFVEDLAAQRGGAS